MKSLTIYSGFRGHPPVDPADGYRPFYGGTCYSQLTSGQTLDVVTYNNRSAIATGPWPVTTDSAQVYARPIDGYSMQEAVTTTLEANVSCTP